MTPTTSAFQDRIYDIEALADGSLLVAGIFPGIATSTTPQIARYKDGEWLDFANGLGSGTALAVSASESGEVAIGGTFYENGNGAVSAYLATLQLPCPASVVSSNANCVGGGPIMTVTSMPFVGGPFGSRTQLGAGDDFAFLIYGLAAANLSLQSVLPYAVPGCVIGAAPDVVVLQVPSNGEVTADLVLPSHAALVGAEFWHQVVALDFSPSGPPLGASASNTVAVTVGLF